MRYLFMLLICLIPIVNLRAQQPDSHQAISKYIDSETVLVGWIDIAQVDAGEVAKFLDSIDAGTPPERDLERIESIQEALVQLKVARIYTLGDLATIFAGPPQIVVPCENPKAVSLFLAAMVGEGEYQFEQDGDNVIGGLPMSLEHTKERNGEPSEKMLAAMQSCSGPHGIAFATPPYVTVSAMAFIQSMFKERKVAEVAQAAEVISSVEWLSFSGTLPPSKAKLRVQTSSKEAATKLTEVASSIAAKLDERAGLLAFAAEGPSAVISVNSLKDATQKMLAIRELMNVRTAQVSNSMKQIALALHNYYSAYNRLPPQSVVDADGKRLLSWRVLILPYLDQQALYEQFHLDEAWDSPHNLKLAETIPFTYKSHGVNEAGPQKTRMLAPLTENTAFGRPGAPLSFRDITDGTSNTIWFVEAPEDKAVIWTKPEDLPVDENEPAKSLMAEGDKGFWASRIDGSVQFLDRERATNEVIKAILTVDGGEVVEY